MTKKISPIANHPLQMTVWQDPARFKVVCAGRRVGKTFYIAERLLFKSTFPNRRNGYMAPTRQHAKDIIWDHLIKRCEHLGWKIKANVSELKIRRQNNSTIELYSAEKSERVRGGKFNYWGLDEFAEYRRKEIWTQDVYPTLSDYRGDADMLFTPKGFNHAYDLFQYAKTAGNWNCFSFRTIDSPFFQTDDGKAEIEEARQNLSDKDFKQEYEASFESHTGRIYYAFDRKKNFTDYEFSRNNGPIYVGQDFNHSPMCSALYQKVNGKLLQFGELFIKTGDTTQTCESLRQQFPNVELKFRPDATGNRKTSNSARSDFDIIKSFGFFIESAKINPRRVDRWACVNRAYEKGQVLVNVKNCPQTVKDRETLVYKEGVCEPDTKDPFAGHMSDASDYAIWQEFPLVKSRSLAVGSYA